MHTFFGSKGNETFGLLLSSLIGAKQGHSIQYKADPYSVFFSCFRPVNIKELLLSLEKEHIIPLLEHRIKTSELFGIFLFVISYCNSSCWKIFLCSCIIMSITVPLSFSSTF
ncbi:MAG: hypothetical protein ACTSPG_02890 [Candidatus Hodarchaeales archaeon]